MCSPDQLPHSTLCVPAIHVAVLPPLHIYSRSFPSNEAAGEEVPMEDNPAYGVINSYITLSRTKRNLLM